MANKSCQTSRLVVQQTHMPSRLPLIISILVFCFSAVAQPSHTVETLKSEFIVSNPPFEACHASTLAELPGNRLMAAWFGGSYEGCNDVAIWASVCTEGSWSGPVKIADGVVNDSVRYACWNPVLFRTTEGWLFLFYKVGKSPREWWGMVRRSHDDGLTWSTPERLPDGFLGPIKNKPIWSESGRILCPSSTESSDQLQWRVHLEITNNELSEWEKVAVDSSSRFGVIQPALLQHPGGKIQMLCRTRQNCIVQSWSGDEGRHWSELTTTGIINPNSGIDAVTLTDSLFVLVYNPAGQGKEWSDGRNVLSVALSNDGKTWKEALKLENENKGEFSYPAVIVTSDGLVHITYTWNRKNIRHVVLLVK